MIKHPKRTFLVNTFGGLGYLFCIFLWGWTGLLYVPMLLENKHVEDFLLPEPREVIVAQPTPSEASPIILIVALAVTVLVILATIIVLLRMPVTIAKTGKAVTTKAADSALPLLTRGHKLPAAKKKRLAANLIKLTKLILILLPVAIGFIGAIIEPPLSFELAMLISSILAIVSLSWFSLQYIFARLLAVDSKLLV